MQLRRPGRHDGQLRRRHRPAPPQLADRRGDRRRARRHLARFAKPHGYLFEVPVDRQLGERAARRAAGRRWAGSRTRRRPIDQRTGIVYLTEDPGAGVGAGLLPLPPRATRANLAGRRGAADARDPRHSPISTPARARAVGAGCRVEWVDDRRAGPGVRRGVGDPTQHVQPGLGAGRGASSTGSRAAGRTSGSDLLRLHQRRRRQERRRQRGRLPRGLRPGLGVPPARTARRHAGPASTSRRATSVLDSPDNLTVTPRGGLMLCEDDASGGDTHPLAPGIENVNRLIGITPRRRGVRVRASTCSTRRARRRLLQPGRRDDVRQRLRPVDRDPGRARRQGMTCADHRAVAARSAVGGELGCLAPRGRHATPEAPRDLAIAGLAGAQHGVVTRSQLMSLGFTKESVARRVRRRPAPPDPPGRVCSRPPRVDPRRPVDGGDAGLRRRAQPRDRRGGLGPALPGGARLHVTVAGDPGRGRRAGISRPSERHTRAGRRRPRYRGIPVTARSGRC